MLLRSIESTLTKSQPQFPFNVPVVKNMAKVAFTSPVTFLVGENGSGKSTFLEALACAVGSITVGSQSVKHDPTLAEVRRLTPHLKLVWTKRTRRGFFMRAEDFFGYARKLNSVREDFQAELARILDSEAFTDVPALAAFFRFVVEETLAGDPHQPCGLPRACAPKASTA